MASPEYAIASLLRRVAVRVFLSKHNELNHRCACGKRHKSSLINRTCDECGRDYTFKTIHVAEEERTT